jgi:uncharacterized OsmC-like protein/alpha-beta hydrolase superfamily lysophospholipase
MASQRKKVNFRNSQDDILAGLMELPADPPKGYILFAHCFTCGKDISSASRVSRALASHGYAVLRFDFTGLGGSDGDFANTSFSSNVEDLVSASNYLREEFEAPDVLIGHSLGGAAVLAAARYVPEAKAVVTIGSPASPAHVVHNFEDQLDTINKQGLAEVHLGGRPFTVKQQFVDDLQEQNQQQAISKLKKALLIFHSPIDVAVSIDEAGKIYSWAKHPKSFISLDNADHLLSRPADAEYVADAIVAWVKRYLRKPAEVTELPEVVAGHVLVAEKNLKFTRSIYTDNHHWLADEPKQAGGDNLGPDPYEMLLAALGACTSMTMRMYANRKQWPVEEIYVSLEHKRIHSDDCEDCDYQGEAKRLDVIERTIRIEGEELSDEQRDKLLEIAGKCPVHLSLENDIQVITMEDNNDN